jgi:hypothetical protein
MKRLPRLGAVLAAALATSCGAALQRLPAGPGQPDPDAAAIFAQATVACRAVSSMSAELRVSGAAGGQRLRGRVLAGLAAPASVYLDAAAPFGASLFIYAAKDAGVTLLLPRDQRVLRDGSPAAVLDAVAGVPLDAVDLRQTMTGCAPEQPLLSGLRFGEAWRAVRLASADAYLRRQSSGAPWRLVAVQHSGEPSGEGWRADYDGFGPDGLPRTVRLVSGDGGRRFDLTVTLAQVEVNPALAAEIFDVTVPPSFSDISLDEVRRAGPLGSSRDRQ